MQQNNEKESTGSSVINKLRLKQLENKIQDLIIKFEEENDAAVRNIDIFRELGSNIPEVFISFQLVKFNNEKFEK